MLSAAIGNYFQLKYLPGDISILEADEIEHLIFNFYLSSVQHFTAYLLIQSKQLIHSNAYLFIQSKRLNHFTA